MTDTADFNLEAAERLASSGVPLEVIAESFSIPTSVLVRTLRRTSLTPEDQQLSVGMRQLAWRAYAESMRIFDEGHPNDKLSLMKTILSRTAGLIGQESSTTLTESKEAFSRIFSAQREGITPHVITAEPIELDEYAPTTSPLGGAYDSGQEAPHDEDPFRPEEEPDWG